MARIEELTDIPPGDVDRIVKLYEMQGAKVQKIKQPDGNWTVRATFDFDDDDGNSGEERPDFDEGGARDFP